MNKPNPNSEYHIKEADYEDLEEIIELWEKVILWHANFDSNFILTKNGKQRYSEYLNNALSKENQIVYKVEGGNKEIIGFLYGYLRQKAIFFKEKKTAHISDIVIKEKYRDGGIGTALIKKFEIDFARKNNVKEISLYVHVSNKKAISFYKKNSFKESMYFMNKEIQKNGI